MITIYSAHVIISLQWPWVNDLMRYMYNCKPNKFNLNFWICNLFQSALRPGYPKKPGLSADTKGLCTLTFSNLELSEKNKSYSLRLDFLGKSSIPCTKKIVLSKSVYQKLKEFEQEKEIDDQIFDLVKVTFIMIAMTFIIVIL